MNMNNENRGSVKLFHTSVFMPESLMKESMTIQKELSTAYMKMSAHVCEHCEDEQRFRMGMSGHEDYKHAYTATELYGILKTLAKEPGTPFEIEATKNSGNEWHVTKYAIRMKFNDSDDMTIVIRPNDNCRTAFIATAWLNYHDDNHYTLDRNKYDTSL